MSAVDTVLLWRLCRELSDRGVVPPALFDALGRLSAVLGVAAPSGGGMMSPRLRADLLDDLGAVLPLAEAAEAGDRFSAELLRARGGAS